MQLLHFIFNRLFKKQASKCRILLLGLDNAGKTSCLKRFSDEEIDHIMPTQGFNIKTLKQQGFDVTLWDLGGQKAIRKYWRDYYDDSDAIIFVIDSSDKRRMAEAATALSELLAEAKLSRVPLLVFANKQDLAHAQSIKTVSEKLLLSDVRDRAWSIQPCSAKTGDGLKEGLMWTMQVIKTNRNEK